MNSTILSWVIRILISILFIVSAYAKIYHDPSAYFSIKEKRAIAGPLFFTTAAVVYLGEIYGAWRSAKYYRKVD